MTNPLRYFAAGVDHQRTRRRLAHLALDHGACASEGGSREIAHRASHGPRERARFRLRCAAGPLELNFGFDAAARTITEYEIREPTPPDATCWP